MKRTITLLSLFLFLFSGQVLAQQEELSDYAIQKRFKEGYQKYKNKVDTVALGDSAVAISDSIDSFLRKWKAHSELLNKALYPETFNEKMQKLRSDARLAVNRLQQLNRQDEQVITLRVRLASYQDHISKLTKEVDSLRHAMAASIHSEKELTGKVRNYRENLEERDELILSFIDSTVIAYQKIDLQALRKLEDIEGSKRLKSDGNALKLIQEISANNLKILKENEGNLYLDDYLRMQTIQQRFEDMWDKLGDKITSIYGGNDAEEIHQQVDHNVAQWDSLLKEKTFNALHDSLNEQDLAINDFDNTEEFYKSINSYLDNQIKQSKEGATSKNYDHYKAFNSFWNKVEGKWRSRFQDAGILSNEQMITISNKTDTWSENAKPESQTMLYWIIGIAILAIILGGLLIREKTKGEKE